MPPGVEPGSGLNIKEIAAQSRIHEKRDVFSFQGSFKQVIEL